MFLFWCDLVVAIRCLGSSTATSTTLQEQKYCDLRDVASVHNNVRKACAICLQIQANGWLHSRVLHDKPNVEFDWAEVQR